MTTRAGVTSAAAEGDAKMERQSIGIQQHSTSSGTRTSNHNHKIGHGLGASARDKTMPDTKDNTMNNKYCCRQQHTQEHSMYLLTTL